MISIFLIWATGHYGWSPVTLFFLLITWIPDVCIIAVFYDKIFSK